MSSAPELSVGPQGLSGRRQVLGTGILAVGLPTVTASLVDHREKVPLATPVLLVLLVVVLAAVVGGVRVGIPAAILGGLALNWFFTQPYGTLAVDEAGPLIVLVVYLAVALIVSLTVGLAARRTAEADRARAEATALASLAGSTLADAEGLPSLLARVRQLFGVREAAMLELQDNSWVTVEAVTSADAPADDEIELQIAVSPTLALRVRGPALFGEDQRVLGAFARAAATALEGRRLAVRAEQAAQFQAADEMRSALLAAVGHDLRTPLAGIKAAVSSLRQDDVAWSPRESAELLETIETSADRLQALVLNLLDASRLQAGVVMPEPERVTLEEIVQRGLLHLASAERVHVELPVDLPEVRADVGLAERVIANLLDNALRYSPAGLLISVTAQARATQVTCDIVDHGPGIPRHLLDQVFAPFQRLGDRGPGGIGLGLAVARGFSEAMGGALQPLTTPGGGLTMRLTLPRAEERP